MSRNFILKLSVVFCLVILPVAVNGQLKERIKLASVLDKIQSYHFNPKEINDDFSIDIYEKYIKQLDPGKQFFIQEDIDQLSSHKTNLDEQILKANFAFHMLANTLLERRIKSVEAYYPELLKTPFSFKEKESIPLKVEQINHSKDSPALKERWRKLLKYQTLSQYIDLVEEATPTKDINVFDEELEAKARETVKKNTARLFERIKKESEEEKISRYLDAVSSTFDPHTNYLLPSSKEDFDISISGKLEGIGAVLREDDGHIKVVRIVSGSAAWRQKQLEAEDIILKVGQGNLDPVSIVGARVRDAVKLIRGKKGSKVKLTVKKPDGQTIVIPIVRDVVVIEETYAKSAVITNDKLQKKFGYILLPSFYRDFKDRAGRNSTEDVRQALREIQKDAVDGVILDLRNNGGGALEDAVQMAGLFIKTGPIVQVKTKASRSRILIDRDPEVVYDGPLVVLLNSFSASASEILAGALQDYGRAIILGSESSYGKGTVQTFLDLDRFVPNQFQNLKPFGSLKLTIQKFYRVTGDSTQFRGVSPDLILPFASDAIEVGEKTLDHSLVFSTIEPIPFKKVSDQKFDLRTLSRKSVGRVKDSDFFKSLSKYNKIREKRREKKQQTLELKSWINEKEKIKKEDDKYTFELSPIPYLVVPTPNLKKNEENKDKLKKISDFHEQVVKDPYLDEAMFILNDLLSQEK